MAISLFSCSYMGVDTYVVEVEVDLSRGLPVFNIVGMGDQAISESKERIRSCFKNVGFEFPVRRVLVNLSPANIRKKGSHFDLSIFLGILANTGHISNIDILKKISNFRRNFFKWKDKINKWSNKRHNFSKRNRFYRRCYPNGKL